MKYLILLISILCLSSKVESPSTNVSCLLLKESYNFLNKNPTDITRQRNFIYRFPGEYNNLVNIFGYKEIGDSLYLGCLYNESYYYINKFFDVRHQNKTLVYNKIILLSKNFIWQADGINIFYDNVTEIIQKDRGDFLIFLNSKSQTEIENVNKMLVSTYFRNGPLISFMKQTGNKYPKVQESFLRLNKKKVYSQ